MEVTVKSLICREEIKKNQLFSSCRIQFTQV